MGCTRLALSAEDVRLWWGYHGDCLPGAAQGHPAVAARSACCLSKISSPNISPDVIAALRKQQQGGKAGVYFGVEGKEVLFILCSNPSDISGFFESLQ